MGLFKEYIRHVSVKKNGSSSCVSDSDDDDSDDDDDDGDDNDDDDDDDGDDGDDMILLYELGFSLQ